MASPMEQALTPFRLAIVGGGPAGTSVLIRAARIGVLSELLSQGGDGNHETAGVLLIDAGPPEGLGAGALGSYAINSNTFIKKFADNVLRDRSEQIPAEAGSKTILEPLRRSQATRDVESYTQRIGPLHVVGRFLTQVGRVLKEEIERHPESACLCYHVVVALYQELNGHWTIHLRQCGKRRKESPSFKNDRRFATLEDGTLVARAHKVVLATGGTQKLPQSLPPPMVGWEQKVVPSDAVLRSTGHLMQRIRGSMVRRNGKAARVVILGASHSGFSAAWLCLHRTDAALFDTKAITILQRGHIKVFYNSKEDAVKAGYCDYDDGNFNRRGQIYPHTGLRGDAKALYEAIVSGREKRVTLLKLSEASACEEAVRDCDVIIWACGYIPQLPAIFGQPRGPEDKRAKLEVCVSSHGQACVNDEAEVCIPDDQGREGPPVGHLLAVGLGYGFHSPYDGPGARADGVAVYLKRAACIILGAVLGPRALGGYESYEAREAELGRREAQRREAREKRDASERPISSPEAPLSAMRSSRAAGAGEARSQWKATMRLSQPRRQSEGTVRQAGRLPELAMTTGKMGLNPTELVDRTADPTVRPLALTHSTAWRLALAQPRTARSFRPALTSPLRRLSTPLASVRQPPPAPRPFCTDTGSMLKPRPPWGSGGGATGRVKHEEVKNAA